MSEGSVAADIAVSDGNVVGKQTRVKPHFDHNGKAGFEIDSEGEFHSFAQGIKRFRLWRKHTASEDIRKWANQNPGKDFVIRHGDKYYGVSRGKKKLVESIEEIQA